LRSYKYNCNVSVLSHIIDIKKELFS
jgi:hypothetical protein